MRRLAACCTLAALGASAQQQETITVTTTRLPQPGFDLAAAIDAVDATVIRADNPMVNLSESLGRVPGILVQNRQNYAQDLQVSSRGFGARASFGVRGVRLIADGIPATMPDGQGQAATFDLASADRIEVLRGPFASLYGNSSGGVVQVFTADGPPVPTVDLAAFAGSYGQRKGNLRLGGDTGTLNYVANVSRFETDGYREHSAAARDQWNSKLGLRVGPGRLILVASGLRQDDTQDPLGLTRAQFEDDPRQADAAAIAFDTRKSIRQSQAGAAWEADLSARDSVALRVYGGDRQVEQFLAQPGDGALASGGVVDLDRRYGGAGARWSHRFIGGERPLTATAGVEHERMGERRRGFVNESGIAGALRRDEDNDVRSTDAYAQAEWEAIPRWVLSGGARRTSVRFETRDFFVSGANPDDSGAATYGRTNSVVGVLFKATPRVHAYANAGEGFETPTFAELAYRPGGGTGLNLALRPARSRHLEAGIKARPAGIRLDAAVFRIETRDEIVVNSASGGRTDFRNAARTRRDGIEVALSARLGEQLEAHVAGTALRARFTEDFVSGGAAQPAGRRLPGVPGAMLHAELAWRDVPRGAHAAIEVRHVGRAYVNDANSDSANAYTIAGVRMGLEQRRGAWKLREFVRVDNVANRRYAGSVIVAEARARYFEPAPGRNWLAGMEASLTF